MSGEAGSGAGARSSAPIRPPVLMTEAGEKLAEVIESAGYGEAELLLLWNKMMAQAIREFLKATVPVVKASSAGRITALILVFQQLDEVLSAYTALLSARRMAVGGADVPGSGDVRTVFGRAQVFVDGSWWQLGEKCET